MNKLKITFWKTIAFVWDVRPRLHLPKYRDYPIASTDIAEEYIYPEGIKVLYEWNEKGKHWIVFSR
jgi:hypothetical protein